MATKNSHRKEIGDWHNFQYTAGVRKAFTKNEKNKSFIFQKRNERLVATVAVARVLITALKTKAETKNC